MRPNLRHDALRRSGPQTTQKHRGQGPLLQSHKQRGFGLVAAMFLIIIMAGAIAAMWRISVTQTATSSLSLQQARAYQAARAGLEWGIYQFINDAPCATPVSISVPDLNGFNVIVDYCSSSQQRKHDDLLEERAGNIVIQRVTATAEYSAPGDPDYTYRKLIVEVEK